MTLQVILSIAWAFSFAERITWKRDIGESTKCLPLLILCGCFSVRGLRPRFTFGMSVQWRYWPLTFLCSTMVRHINNVVVAVATPEQTASRMVPSLWWSVEHTLRYYFLKTSSSNNSATHQTLRSCTLTYTTYNGTCKQLNCTLIQLLVLACEKQRQWIHYLAKVAWKYKHTVHSLTAPPPHHIVFF